MSEFLTMGEYAKRRGVSLQAVSKAVKKGRISTVTDDNGKRKIDPAMADREWAGNSDPSKFRSSGFDNRAPQIGTPANYNDSKALKEEYLAKLAQLEYEEKSGKLVDADEIKKEWALVASTVRTKVLGIPSKTRQRLPELTPDAYLVLESIVREALEDLSGDN